MNSIRMIKNIFVFMLAAWVCFSSAAHGAGPSDFDKKEEDTFYVAAKAYQDGFYDVSLVLLDRKSVV